MEDFELIALGEKIAHAKERAIIDEASKKFMREGEDERDSGSESSEALEDAIPDLPENQAAREFLKNAPTKKGQIFMPLGKEVKVMQCWKCKAYGHR